MEIVFKIVFGVAILMFCLLVIGIFILIIKILFMFGPEVTLMGIKMVPAAGGM